jgi:Variant UBP zinc finger
MASNLSDADTRIILDGLARLKPPTLSQSVHREECTQCFDNQVRPRSRIDMIRSRDTRSLFVRHRRTILRESTFALPASTVVVSLQSATTHIRITKRRAMPLRSTSSGERAPDRSACVHRRVIFPSHPT